MLTGARRRGVRRTFIGALVVLLAAIGSLVIFRATSGPEEPTYRIGECTYWAHEKRPELTQGTKGLPAFAWEDWARRNGFVVDLWPRDGDVAVWGRYVGAGAEGHVAYVEGVGVEGEVYVSEMNHDGCRDVSYGRLSPERLSTALFIHRKE